MFRGGDYVDKQGFNDLRGKPGHNYMNTDDIAGARPKKHFQPTTKGMMHQAGANIMDNNMMSAAGVKQVAAPGQRGISDVWSMGQQYEKYEPKQERNPLMTKDINGEKRN
jgi:hypothetical protein